MTLTCYSGCHGGGGCSLACQSQGQAGRFDWVGGRVRIAGQHEGRKSYVGGCHERKALRERERGERSIEADITTALGPSLV